MSAPGSRDTISTRAGLGGSVEGMRLFFWLRDRLFGALGIISPNTGRRYGSAPSVEPTWYPPTPPKR